MLHPAKAPLELGNYPISDEAVLDALLGNPALGVYRRKMELLAVSNCYKPLVTSLTY